MPQSVVRMTGAFRASKSSPEQWEAYAGRPAFVGKPLRKAVEAPAVRRRTHSGTRMRALTIGAVPSVAKPAGALFDGTGVNRECDQLRQSNEPIPFSRSASPHSLLPPANPFEERYHATGRRSW